MTMLDKKKSTPKDKDVVEAELFEAISHPTRIKILKIVNTDARGFAELKRKLGISSSGNLSHHLNKLVTLIELNSDGKYKITDQGREALLAIEIVNISDKHWIATTYAAISALIFYGLFLTIFIISNLETIIGLPISLIPFCALIGAIMVFIIFRFLLIRSYRRGNFSFLTGTGKAKRKIED